MGWGGGGGTGGETSKASAWPRLRVTTSRKIWLGRRAACQQLPCCTFNMYGKGDWSLPLQRVTLGVWLSLCCTSGQHICGRAPPTFFSPTPPLSTERERERERDVLIHFNTRVFSFILSLSLSLSHPSPHTQMHTLSRLLSQLSTPRHQMMKMLHRLSTLISLMKNNNKS